MVLFFRLNVISKNLNNFRYAVTKSLLIPSYQQRAIFTNTSGVKFVKNNRHNLKIPQCPDVEEYFKKVKKGDSEKKVSSHNAPQPSNLDERHRGKAIDDTQQQKPQTPVSPSYPLAYPPPAHPPSTSTTVFPTFFNDYKVDNKIQPQTLKDQAEPQIYNKPKHNFLWIALAAAGLCGIGALLWYRNSSDDDKKMADVCVEQTDDVLDEVNISTGVSKENDWTTITDKTKGSDTNLSTNVSKSTINNASEDAHESTTSVVSKEIDALTVKEVSEASKGAHATEDASKSTEVSKNTQGSINSVVSNKVNESAVRDVAKSVDELKSSNLSTKDLPSTTDGNSRADVSETCPKGVSLKIPYLIIGGGTASCAAYRAIREHDPKAKILIVSNETYPPYMRPQLSKDLWSAENSNVKDVQRQLFFEPINFYANPLRLSNDANGGIGILYGSTAKSLNTFERKVILTDGTEIEYDECLLATGSKPRNLVIFQTAPSGVRNKISFYRNIKDFERLKEIVDKSESICVVGGGFVGSELSYSLAQYAGDTKNLKIYQIFHEEGNMGISLPRYLSHWIKKRLMDCGVFIIPNTQVDSVKMENSKLKLGLLDGKIVVVNHVIVALGSKPDALLANTSGLAVSSSNDGILVNERLECRPHVFVAGDAAILPGMSGKETEKSHDHAIATGRLAGENMTGLNKSFNHKSMFWSNIGQHISFETVGLIDAALETVGVFSKDSDITLNEKNTLDGLIDAALDTVGVFSKDSDIILNERNTSDLKAEEKVAAPNNKGVIFYLHRGQLVGVLLCNVFNKINVARQAIADGIDISDRNAIAKLFGIEND